MSEQSRANRFVPFLFTLAARPSVELVAVFCLGVISLSVASNWVYDVARNPADLVIPQSLGVLVGLAVLLGLAFLLYQRDRRNTLSRYDIQTRVTEGATAPHRGLVWLLSPSSIDHPVFAILHHYGAHAPHTLEHCWLILTSGDARLDDARRALEERLVALDVKVKLHPTEVPRPDVESTYRAADQIFQEELSQVGLSRADVIADITGGLKPMTTGMVLASLVRNVSLEYVESDRDESGNPIDRTQRVVGVDVDFFWSAQRAK